MVEGLLRSEDYYKVRCVEPQGGEQTLNFQLMCRAEGHNNKTSLYMF